MQATPLSGEVTEDALTSQLCFQCCNETRKEPRTLLPQLFYKTEKSGPAGTSRLPLFQRHFIPSLP